MKFLVVDDNEGRRRMIVSLIGDPAEELIECGDGTEAALQIKGALNRA